MLGEAQTKISTIIKVFSNKQVLVTITDNDKFGSTYCAKKVSLDGQGMTDPMSMMMYGMDGAGSDPFDDDLDADPDAQPAEPMPRETIETQLLLGDRKSQEIGELFTSSLFKMIDKAPRFTGLEGMVLQVSLGALRRPANERGIGM